MKSIGAKRRNEICGYKPKTSSKNTKTLNILVQNEKKQAQKTKKHEKLWY